MLALPPRLLRMAAQLVLRNELTRRRAALTLRLLAETRLPLVAAARLAERAPEPGLAQAPRDADPFVVRFDDAPAADRDGPLGGHDVVVKDSIDVAGARTGFG